MSISSWVVVQMNSSSKSMTVAVWERADWGKGKELCQVELGDKPTTTWKAIYILRWKPERKPAPRSNKLQGSNIVRPSSQNDFILFLFLFVCVWFFFSYLNHFPFAIYHNVKSQLDQSRLWHYSLSANEWILLFFGLLCNPILSDKMLRAMLCC